MFKSGTTALGLITVAPPTAPNIVYAFAVGSCQITSSGDTNVLGTAVQVVGMRGLKFVRRCRPQALGGKPSNGSPFGRTRPIPLPKRASDGSRPGKYPSRTSAGGLVTLEKPFRPVVSLWVKN